MKWRNLAIRTGVIAAVCLNLFCVGAAPGPIRVSSNGRYFVDADGEPFYFLADTQWELFRRYSLHDAKLILENRKGKGFTVVMVMLTVVGSGTGANLEGQRPWLNDNPATPNSDYFAKVDEIVKLAQANDIHLLIGIYHQTHGSRITVENAKAWAGWVTRRYRDHPNIMWTLYPKAMDSYRPIISKLAEGIQEGDGGKHLVSIHPDPSPATSSFMHAEPWLRFNSIQVWNQLRSVYPMTLSDYAKLPAKPVTMLEGVYEGGEEYGYPITPLLVRRQAYYTCLAGGFHGYGHNDSWRVKLRWREALEDPGATQMTVLKTIFTRLPEWWTLMPDQGVFISGGNTNGDVLTLGARSANGKWIMAYVAGQPNITVNMAKITAGDSASAEWIDPVAGKEELIGLFRTREPQSFKRPPTWEDAVLVVKAATSASEKSAALKGRNGVRSTKTVGATPPWFPKAPPLPQPRGEVIRVADADELLAAVDRVGRAGTILLADGQYKVPRVVVLQNKKDLTIRSEAADPIRVALSGKGWESNDKHDDIIHIGQCDGVTIANLTFADCHSYGIKVEAENAPKNIHIYNCRFRDIGIRAVKGSAGQDPNTRAVKGSIRYCSFENTKVPPSDWLFGGDYISAIDMMALEDWTFSDNFFRNIKGRNGGGRAAIFIWVRSRQVIVERNLIIDCDRGVAFGNPAESTANLSGEQLAYVSEGLIRNNFIIGGADCGIELWHAKRVKVFNNSIWRPEQNWSRGIRVGTGTSQTEIANNLVHGEIRLDGGEANLRQNLARRLDGYFVDPLSGNLELTSAASDAIDHGLSLPEVTDDIRKRLRAESPDLGAWEFDPEEKKAR
jgi:hypothetical protein